MVSQHPVELVPREDAARASPHHGPVQVEAEQPHRLVEGRLSVVMEPVETRGSEGLPLAALWLLGALFPCDPEMLMAVSGGLELAFSVRARVEQVGALVETAPETEAVAQPGAVHQQRRVRRGAAQLPQQSRQRRLPVLHEDVREPSQERVVARVGRAEEREGWPDVDELPAEGDQRPAEDLPLLGPAAAGRGPDPSEHGRAVDRGWKGLRSEVKRSSYSSTSN